MKRLQVTKPILSLIWFAVEQDSTKPNPTVPIVGAKATRSFVKIMGLLEEHFPEKPMSISPASEGRVSVNWTFFESDDAESEIDTAIQDLLIGKDEFEMMRSYLDRALVRNHLVLNRFTRKLLNDADLAFEDAKDERPQLSKSDKKKRVAK